MSKRLLSALMSLVMLVSCMYPLSLTASAATYAQQLRDKGFPESYIDDLVKLHSKYPNWEFKPFKTGLKWSEAVAGERKIHSNQMLEYSSSKSSVYYCSCDKCKNSTGSLRPASEWAVEYYMDPRNWLDEKHIFQFESTAYNSAHTQSGVESIISSTWMKNANITYLNTSGTSVTYKDSNGNKVKYSQAIMDAAKASNMSAYAIASRIVKEVGNSKPTASGVVGNRAPFNGIYNYYSIGANSTGTQGLEWASGFMRATKSTTLYDSKATISTGQRMSYIKESKNYYYVKLYTRNGSSYTSGKTDWVLKSAVSTQYFTYERPWTDPYKAIVGGAKYISASYSKQYTPYLQKFNVNSSSGSLYSHEYMTNVNAVSTEAVSAYNAYSKAGQLSNAKTFYIPVFSSMPADTSTFKNGWVKKNGKWYYYKNNVYQTGWLKDSNKWYYLDSSGAMVTGWLKDSNKWYYLDSSGAMVIGWLKNNSKWYYMNSKGAMVTGWCTVSGKRYYFKSSGAMVTGWCKIGGKWYYFNSKGAMTTGWQKVSNKWYYMNSDGVMQTGWLKVNGKTYYLSSSGAMVTGFQTISGKKYYFNSSGAMLTGWQTISEKHYYFEKDGVMHTGWLELNGEKYYFDANGVMLTGEQTIDNEKYTFDSNGVLKTSDTEE